MTTKRQEIVDEIEARLQGIQSGVIVGTTPKTHVYSNTVGLVDRRVIDPESLGDSEFPAVAILPSHITEGLGATDEAAYLARWTIGLSLYVKDPNATSLRDTNVWVLLEDWWHDVECALELGGPALEHAPDVQLNFKLWDPQVVETNPKFGIGAYVVAVDYNHFCFG